MDLRLELVINGATTGRIVAATARGDRYLVAADDLRSAGMRIDPSVTGNVDVTQLPEVEAHCDQGTQRLLLRVPVDWLPRQTLGHDGAIARISPQSSFGALVNYDLYVSGSTGGGSYGSLWNEVRLFGTFGAVRNVGTYRMGLSSGSGGDRYTRYDTNWTYVDEERILTYEVGDLVTRTLSWGNPVRLGGAQLSRDFAVRPDIVTYPLPTFSGTASVPSAVDLFVNGYRASGGSLQPGPFTLSDRPYVNGAGEAVVVTTDAQGRRVSTSIPFYVASTLLRPGLTDYAFAAGKLRRNYGLGNFSYGSTAASAAWRHGLTEFLTLEAQAQAAGSLHLAGAGGVLRLGNAGVIDGSATISRHAGKAGSQVTFGYQYSNRRFNLTASHVRRDDSFSDLTGYGLSGYRLPRRQTQLTAGIGLGAHGTVGMSYIDTRQRDDRFRLLDLSYSRLFWRNGSLNLSVNREIGHGGTTATLRLLAPFGRTGSAVAGIERTRDGTIQEHINYGRAVPSEGGLGWTAAGSRNAGRDSQYQADITWRTQSLQFQGGVYGGRGNRSQWGDVSGSLVLMDGGAFAANRINDAFVLVSTDGTANVPIRYENQSAGTTDRNGHLLIPWTAAYYGAKYAIDPLDLPADASIPVIEQHAAVKLGSGRIVHFPIRRLLAANVLLNDAAGNPLKAGTPVAADNGSVFYVGWDGAVYLEGLQPLNRITATLSDGATCSATFPFQEPGAAIAQLGPLTCR